MESYIRFLRARGVMHGKPVPISGGVTRFIHGSAQNGSEWGRK
jgi:hypothetical protein